MKAASACHELNQARRTDSFAKAKEANLKAGLKNKKKFKPVSTRRAAQLVKYSRLRRAFLAEHPFCQVAQNEWFIKTIKHAVATCRIDVPKGGLMEPSPFRHKSGGVMLNEPPNGLPPATEIHHVRGRRGEMLNDDRYWLAVCRESHERIHRNPKWARERGYIQKP